MKKIIILIITIFFTSSCTDEINQEGIKANEGIIRDINSAMNFYMNSEGYLPDDIEILEEMGFYQTPKEDEYVIIIDNNKIILTNLLYDIISTYNIETQNFDHKQK